MAMARPQGTKNSASTALVASLDGRPQQRDKQRSSPVPLPPTFPQKPLQLTGAERQKGAAQRPLQVNDTMLHVLHQELSGATLRNEFGDTSPLMEGSNVVNSNRQGATLSRSDVQNALSTIISRQNAEWELRRCRLLEMLNCETDRAIQEKVADDDSRTFGMFSKPLCIVLQTLLAESRKQWAALLSARMHTLKKDVQQTSVLPTSTSNPSGSSSDDADEVKWSVDHLFRTLVEGLNSAKTEKLIVMHMLGGERSVSYDSIDSFRLLTVFRAPVQELLARYEALAPSLTTLRRYFSALHPSNGCSRTYDHTDPSFYDTENDLAFFLQSCTTPTALTELLRGGVCPSLRRLLYARALQLPLSVTDGTSLFESRGELKTNHIGDVITGCLSFATKHSRDRIRCRTHHTYSTRDQEYMTMVLQTVITVDNLQSVGNDDRYFIFSDETRLLGHSLILDKSLPDMLLSNTLKQMGRPPEQIESYLVFLQRATADSDDNQSGMHERQPISIPCGFFPISSCTLLIAPVCYITGDTVEQYNLLSALFGQLWCRLQGPTPELLHCCWMFEALVGRFAPSACLHATRTLGFPPLRLAFQWMLSAFVNVLEPAELLTFWDLILSYHVEEMFGGAGAFSVSLDTDMATTEGESSVMPCALWLLPLLAASLFVYRAPLVERCATAEEMLLVFKGNHHLRCRPLLQFILFMAK